MKTFKEYITEACWKNYKQVGMKKRGKRWFLIVFLKRIKRKSNIFFLLLY